MTSQKKTAMLGRLGEVKTVDHILKTKNVMVMVIHKKNKNSESFRLQEVFGAPDRQLLQLKHLDRVVNKLRLFPPVPLIVRKVLKDISLPSGRVLPTGSSVAVSTFDIHRDPKYWGPDAEFFDPDWFPPKRLNLQHPCSYIPFSNGPRKCV